MLFVVVVLLLLVHVTYLIVFLDATESLGGQSHSSLVPDLLARVLRLLVHAEELGRAAHEKPAKKQI